MARRKRRKKKSLDRTFADAIIAMMLASVFGIYILFQKTSPLLASLICGAGTGLFFLLFLYLFTQHRKKKADQLAQMSFSRMNPIKFEHAVAELFRQQGFSARVTQARNDKGIDILLKKEGVRYAVQCKRYKNNIGPGAIRDFVGALDGASLTEGYFVTTSDYTKMAKNAGKNSSTNIRLINGTQLGKWHNKIKNNYDTSLIQVDWWQSMQTWQQYTIVLLTTLLIATITGSAIFILTTM